jgi:hypothetical protein
MKLWNSPGQRRGAQLVTYKIDIFDKVIFVGFLSSEVWRFYFIFMGLFVIQSWKKNSMFFFFKFVIFVYFVAQNNNIAVAVVNM